MSFKGKKVLVTGHEGFVGRNLIQELNTDNVDIITLTDSDGKKIDVRDWQKIQKIEKPDIIYHLAALTYIPSAYKNPRKTYEVNVLGTLNLLELARISNVQKFIYTSSYVYGVPKYLPIDELHPLNPNNPYSRSKIQAEMLIKSYYHDFGIKSIILRPFNIYGEGQRDDFLIPTIVNQLRKRKIKLKDPNPRRDFVHVFDVINALIKAGTCEYDFETFNVGYGKSFSVKEIVNMIIGIYGESVEVNFGEGRRRNEINDTIANIAKIQNKLQWEPTIGLQTGLYNLIKGFKRYE